MSNCKNESWKHLLMRSVYKSKKEFLVNIFSTFRVMNHHQPAAEEEQEQHCYRFAQLYVSSEYTSNLNSNAPKGIMKKYVLQVKGQTQKCAG